MPTQKAVEEFENQCYEFDCSSFRGKIFPSSFFCSCCDESEGSNTNQLEFGQCLISKTIIDLWLTPYRPYILQLLAVLSFNLPVNPLYYLVK